MAAPVITLSKGEEALIDALPATPAGEAARAALSASGLPTRRVEAFKWSDLRAALAEAVPGAAGQPGAHLIAGALEITAHADGLQIEGDKPDGVSLSTVETAPGDPAAPLSLVVRARAPRTLRVEVADGATATLSVVRAPGAGLALEIVVGAGAAVTLVEHTTAQGGLGTLSLDVDVAAGGSLSRVTVQEGTADVIDLADARVSLGEAARFTQTGLMFGARLARASLLVRMEGEGAACRVDGAYLLAQALHGDFTTRVEHAAPGGTTSELFKGAVMDKARGVFQGKILVERGAQQTDARQNHHALMLTEGAEVDAKPELEIYADNVQCAHGNTIGALDEQALFYMRSRGIPLPAARALLIHAFVVEALEGVADEGLRGHLEGRAQAWLERAFP